MRLKSLDSLRGVAAMVVVFYHCFLVFPERSTPSAFTTLLRFLLAGPAAVLVFFVLSGMVLAMTFVNRDGEKYIIFLAKRFFRIWPPFAVAIVVSALLMSVIGTSKVAGVSNWFSYTWSQPIDASILLQHLLMLGSTKTLDNPMWSLIHEMRVSCIFPLLVAVTMRNTVFSVLVSILIVLICAKLPYFFPLPYWLSSIVSTGIYLFLFVAGIVIALRLKSLRDLLSRQNALTHLILWAVALAALACAPSRTDIVDGLKPAMELLVSGAGASLIVLLCATEGRVFALLLGPIPNYLGRISYSLYLFHVIVLAAVLHATNGIVSLQVGVSGAILLSIVVADFAQRFIEVPSSRFVKRLVHAAR